MLDASFDVINKLSTMAFGASHALTGKPGDLKLIQKIIDQLSDPSQHPPVMEAAGAVFGRVLAQDIGMEWIIVVWDDERVISLSDPTTTVIVYPLSVILKRAMNKDPIDIAYLYNGIRTSVLNLRADPRFAEEALAAQKAET